MKVPRLVGVIRRRVLVNYRVAPEVMARALPAPFRPKLHAGWAVAGICLIRLEGIRPRGLPAVLGLSSENAAHRVAVTWTDGGRDQEGVFIPRRDTSSLANRLVGGTLFPGEHHPATFRVDDDGTALALTMRSWDGTVRVEVAGQTAPTLPPASIFGSLREASAFFERGSLGYSTTADRDRYDGLVLETTRWAVTPLAVRAVASSYFDDEARFPVGAIAFDHALVMRDIAHAWRAAPDLYGLATG